MVSPTETRQATVRTSPAAVEFAHTLEPERQIQNELATPMLIDQALGKGEITLGEHTLYLAYAVYDYESLPQQFKSNVPWGGTTLVRELKDRVSSVEEMCSYSIEVQEKLRRLLPQSVECTQ